MRNLEMKKTYLFLDTIKQLQTTPLNIELLKIHKNDNSYDRTRITTIPAPRVPTGEYSV